MGLLNKFPSFQQLQINAVGAIRRFPLTLLSAVVGTVAGIILIENPDGFNRQLFEKLLMVTCLGLPLFIALTLLAEKHQWRRQVTFVCQGVGVILLVVYFFSLPDGVTDFGSYMLRFALLVIGLHFLVACLPYIGGSQTHGFWQYNMSLFHRILTVAVFSGVMYIGLSIALAAADNLFGFEVKPERYFQLWTIMAGAFNTWLFLAGVPKELDTLDTTTDYPKGLAVFAQYILLPLVALYFVILIAYEAKIIIDWNWPIGWVSELVLWFSVVGILSLLLLYPLRKQAEKRWVQTFVKWFFRGLVLLVPLLLLAILRRISDYGVTEPRYLVLIMAVGLVIVTLYFLFSKTRDIRIIPILLATGAFLAAYGPWSASAVSLWSQQGRLETLLTQNGLLVDGSIQEAEQEPSFEDRKQMSSIISYIADWHGPEQFSKWLGEGAIDSPDAEERYSLARETAEAFGFDFVDQYTTSESDAGFSISGGRDGSPLNSYKVTGFDYLVEFSLTDANDFQQSFPMVFDSCFVGLDTTGLVLDVRIDGTFHFRMSPHLMSLVEAYGDLAVPVIDRTFYDDAAGLEVKLVLEHVRGSKEDGELHVDIFDGHLLIRRL